MGEYQRVRGRIWVIVQWPTPAGSNAVTSCRNSWFVCGAGLWAAGCWRVSRWLVSHQTTTVRWGLRVEQSLQRGGSNPGHHGASAIELPEKAAQVWRCNARRGMAPRGDRLLKREKL